MSQATHGSGRGALEARPCTQKKALLGAEIQQKNMANSTVSTEKPKHPEISCSNKKSDN